MTATRSTAPVVIRDAALHDVECLKRATHQTNAVGAGLAGFAATLASARLSRRVVSAL
jgi:hypothetical protein